MTDGEAGAESARRAELAQRLRARVRSLTRPEIEAVVAAGKRLEAGPGAWKGGAFWIADTAGARLTGGARDALDDLFRHFYPDLAFALTGSDLEREAATAPPPRGLLGRLLGGGGTSERELSGKASEVIEQLGIKDVWFGAACVWNACCAVLVGDELDPTLPTRLAAPWREAIGALPA